MEINLDTLSTPCYLVDEGLVLKNLKILKSVSDQTGCRILLAQKAFSMYSLYPLIGRYLAGTTASSLHEARLGHEEMGGETHIFAPAYSAADMGEIIGICDHIVFNSFAQWNAHREAVLGSGQTIECGLRINPEYSELETEIYNPCAPGSRLGITKDAFERGSCQSDALDGISGLHFHTMCEQDSGPLWHTIQAVEAGFGEYLPRMKWINFGGGHHITKDGYDLQTLIRSIDYVQNKYQVQVYLEPGEAVALNAGYLVSEVMDILENGMRLAILDTSAECHMPDVLEMPYRPEIIGAGQPGEKPYTYRFGGPTCLAGDIIGDYSFDGPLKVGDRLVFCDMAIYSMVKNNTFNGINLPSILLKRLDGSIQTVKTFGYEDFKSRL